MRIKRRKCREVKIGGVRIGGDNPLAVQSMIKVATSDLSATIREINQLRNAGCQIVRVAVRDNKDAATLREIKRRSVLPLVADIHFDKNLAIKAINSGVDKIRLNPGNIYKKEEIKEIAKAAKKACIPIRVGVNSGSLRCRKQDAGNRMQESEKMVKSALEYIKLLEGFGFYDIVISLKSSDIFTAIQANKEIIKHCDYPLHLGVTATGPSFTGIIKSAIVIGELLSEGIGDTIRISLTDKPVKEVKTAYSILGALGLTNTGPQIISCPTCGRCEVDLIKIVNELEKKLYTLHFKLYTPPPKVAIMGCMVNGPGEARAADLGIAFGRKEGLLFSKGKPIKKVPFSKCVDVLLQGLADFL
ncbi:MAG: flavodoxin-dependent (E)-4-hydroxy-3-methylbut-2-enyl-diphosphate synthase [Candidatus Omnitrophota bacterium]